MCTHGCCWSCFCSVDHILLSPPNIKRPLRLQNRSTCDSLSLFNSLSYGRPVVIQYSAGQVWWCLLSPNYFLITSARACFVGCLHYPLVANSSSWAGATLKLWLICLAACCPTGVGPLSICQLLGVGLWWVAGYLTPEEKGMNIGDWWFQIVHPCQSAAKPLKQTCQLCISFWRENYCLTLTYLLYPTTRTNMDRRVGHVAASAILMSGRITWPGLWDTQLYLFLHLPVWKLTCIRVPVYILLSIGICSKVVYHIHALPDDPYHFSGFKCEK